MKRLAITLIALFCVLGTQAQYDRQQILKVYNWDEYIGKGVIEKFEKSGKHDKAVYYTAFLLFDVFYTTNKAEWRQQENIEYKAKTELRAY